MHGKLPDAPEGAIFPTARAFSEQPHTAADTSARSCSGLPPMCPASPAHLCSDTFKQILRDVLGKDAGLALFHITGRGPYSERACYYYAAGRPPNLDLVVDLIRSPQGEPFYNALMAGCTAPWWLDRERRLRNAAKVEGLDLER